MVHYVQNGLTARVQSADIGDPKWCLDTNVYLTRVSVDLIPEGAEKGNPAPALTLSFQTSGTDDARDNPKSALQHAFAAGNLVTLTGVETDGARLKPTSSNANGSKPIVTVALNGTDASTYEFYK